MLYLNISACKVADKFHPVMGSWFSLELNLSSGSWEAQVATGTSNSKFHLGKRRRYHPVVAMKLQYLKLNNQSLLQSL